MRIIQKGTGSPPVWVGHVTCNYCSAQPEITEKDVQWRGVCVPRYRHDVDGDCIGGSFEVQCPECDGYNAVNPPQHVRDRIPHSNF